MRKLDAEYSLCSSISMVGESVPDLLAKGLRSPDKIVPYLKSQYSRYKYGASILNRPHQKEWLHQFIKQDEFIIVVLDSCRFDYFEQEVSKHLNGELDMVYTSATATKNYIQRIWDQTYPDITYLTALSAPTDHAFERDGDSYRPSEHFDNFVHVWQKCENKELGAVPPEKMTEAAIHQNDDRMIVHYVQPHAPYIGDYRLRESDDRTWGDSLQDIYEKIGRYNLSDKEIGDDELKQAYQSNLSRALSSVHELVTHFDRPIVVTADHGEMLGENGRYIHGGHATEELCSLPWYEVDRSLTGTASKTNVEATDQTESDFTKEEVEEQLKDLGYL